MTNRRRKNRTWKSLTCNTSPPAVNERDNKTDRAGRPLKIMKIITKHDGKLPNLVGEWEMFFLFVFFVRTRATSKRVRYASNLFFYIFFKKTHYSYATLSEGHDEPLGNPRGFEEC